MTARKCYRIKLYHCQKSRFLYFVHGSKMQVIYLDLSKGKKFIFPKLFMQYSNNDDDDDTVVDDDGHRKRRRRKFWQ